MRLFRSLLCSAVCLFAAHTSARATELYHVDFAGNDVGEYQIVFGHPTVQPSVGSLTDALLFHAIASYEQIQLPITTKGTRYHLQCDLLTHALKNSFYAFSINLDTPQVRSIDFHGGLNRIDIYQPSGAGSGNPGSFSDDQVAHLDVNIDFSTGLWTVSVNGASGYSGSFAATELRSIRFNLSPWRSGATDAPNLTVALDNVVVTVDEDPVVTPPPGTGTIPPRYLVGLTGTETLFGGLGTGPVPFTRVDLLRGVAKAQQPALDPATLELVYDVETKQLLVVKNVDGSTVAIVYTLTNDQQVDFGESDVIGSPSEIIRRADLLESGGAVSVGSIAGLLRQRRDTTGSLNYYRWIADFQALSQTGGVFVSYLPFYNQNQHVPMLLRGQFKVRNLPFVPESTVQR